MKMSYHEPYNRLLNPLRMKVVQGLLTFLAPLIATGNALTCMSCLSLNACEANCTSYRTVQCSSEYCATAYRKTSENGKDTYDVMRTCAPIDKCNMVGGFTYSNFKWTLGIGCCSSDNCTPELPQLPEESSTSNGVQCKTCSSIQSTVCEAKGNIMCTGNETKCVTYSQTILDEASVYRGCGTQSLCDFGQYTTKMLGVTVEHSFTCVSLGIISGGLAPGIILTVVICVILMNHWI